MSKIITRAKLPLWYTEGFNPKPKMIFAAPLSIGTESVCEFLDIRLIDDVPAEEVKARLNANMTDETQVIEAYYTEDKLTDLKWLSYSIDIKTDGASDELARTCENALLKDKVLITKKAKPREEAPVVDIRPLIKSVQVSCNGDTLHLDAVLSADASSFLNPEYVVKALRAECGILSNPDLTKEYYTIMRTAAYREDMSEFR
jgi:radical SAM-linked protein